jgi:SAM-dependent methyltransferase
MYNRLRTSLDAHHVHPRGIVGRFIGARMARQHQPETDWTLSLLNLSRTDRVLEIGFGGGRLLGLMAQQAGFVAGLDISSTMVRAARRRFARQISAGTMAVLQGDVSSLPLAPSTPTISGRSRSRCWRVSHAC